jgi:hypothetical protein
VIRATLRSPRTTTPTVACHARPHAGLLFVWRSKLCAIRVLKLPH